MNNQPIQFKDEDVSSILLYHLNEQLLHTEKKSFQELPTIETVTPQQLNNLKSAYIDDNDILTLEDLKYVKGLTRLTIDLDKEVNLEPLTYLTNLEELTVSVPISNTTNLLPISRLTKLKRLAIGVHSTKESQAIHNISFVRNLTNLEDLTILGMLVKTLEPLSNLMHLKRLKLNQVRTSNQDSPRFEPLINLVNLESLTLRDFQKGIDLSILSKRGVIKELHLYNCGTPNVTHISQFEKLEKVFLSANSKVLDLTPLTSLRYLRKADLIGVKLAIVPTSLEGKVKIIDE